jgi:uncharacterized membrane protein
VRICGQTSMSRSVGSGLRSAVWFIPVMCVIGGVVLSLGTLAIDRALDYEAVPRWITGGPDAAIGILTTIAASMVSLAALVLTITMVVVQLAMGQFSPRIVQTFLRDRPSQFAIGLFVATFTHAMLAMREVSLDGDGQVPRIAVVVSYLLVLLSIAMLVLYVDHIGRSLRVSALIELVGEDTRRLLDEQYPDRLSPDQADTMLIVAPSSGVVTAVDRAKLVELAVAGSCELHVVPAVGSFVPAGAPLIRIEGDGGDVDRDAVIKALSLGLERTMDEDVAFGFRMLVDVAERSLSDSPFLDPTTAVQAIDRLHDGLRQLATRVIPDGIHRDASGTIRVTMPAMSWDDYVHLAFTEIRLAGLTSPQITRRLTAALGDLLAVVPHERRNVLEQHLTLLQDSVQDAPLTEFDREMAVAPDVQGLGTAAGRPTPP